MGRSEPREENRTFGQYLRRIREERRISLDVVEEMTVGYPEPVTKSHLSRIENGQAIPTFPRMFALSQVYGMPIATLAERFEINLKRGMTSLDLSGKTHDEILDEARLLRLAGRYADALMIYEAMLDDFAAVGEGDRDVSAFTDLRLERAKSLFHLGRYGLAKEESEKILNSPALSDTQRVLALQYFVICSYRLGRFNIALMGLEHVERVMGGADIPTRLRADLEAIRGNTLEALGNREQAIESYRAALKHYLELKIAFEACKTRINMSSAFIEIGKHSQAKRLLRQALTDADAGGYDRLTALAMSNLGLIAYRAEELSAAEGYCIRSNSIARPRDYFKVVFRNCYYLWKIALRRGDVAAARVNERSLKSYLGRIEDRLPEIDSYRDYLAGGKS